MLDRLLNILLFVIIIIGMSFLGITDPKEKIVVIRKTETVIKYESVYNLQKNKRHDKYDAGVLDNMDYIANCIYVPLVRFASNQLCKSITIPINSYYRNWQGHSDHNEGLALDLDIDGMGLDGFNNRDIYEYIRDSLTFHQLIIYGNPKNPSHIHVSVHRNNNRCQILRAYKWRGKRYYKKYY